MTIFKFCACDVFIFSVTNIHADVQFNLATLRFLMLCCDGGVDAYKLVAVDKNEFGFNLMCHNPIRLWYTSQNDRSHGIVTHQARTKFWKKVFGCLAFPIFLCSVKCMG